MRCNASQICSITDETEYGDMPCMSIGVHLSHTGDGPEETVTIPLTGDRGAVRIRARVAVDDIIDKYMGAGRETDPEPERDVSE